MATNALAAVDTRPIENKLATLKQRAEAIQVVDQESYAICCQVVLDGRAEVKAIGFVLDPGIDSAKQHLEKLKNDKAQFVNRVTPIVQMAEQKAEAYKAEERRKAAAEQERINAQLRVEAARKSEEERKAAEKEAEEERKRQEKAAADARKAGEIGKREEAKLKKQAQDDADRAKELAARQAEDAAKNVKTVTVAPSVPTVAGIKKRVNQRFEVVDAAKLPRAFLKADDVAIGEAVRKLKNPALAMTTIPGIRVWEEDSI